MQNFLHFIKYFFLIAACFLFGIVKSTAQTCSASLGDPIVNIDFGSGANFGAPLSSSSSSLQYQQDVCPSDGYYAIVNHTAGCWANDVVWHTATDHTSGGAGTGYFMLINASNQPSNFYVQTISGLCPGTNYQFAAWLVNMCSRAGTLPNITFTIESTDGQNILGTYNTSDISIVNPFTWKQYGFYFTTPPNISAVVLRMRNNSPGGVGNDLGLDDITFRPAGPALKTSVSGNVSDTINICADNNSVYNFTSAIENCYAATAYQWQLSTDGTSWNNIVNATSSTYVRQPTIAGTYFYRLLVSEAINVGVTTCRVASNLVTVNVNTLPSLTVSNTGPICSGKLLSLKALGGNTYKWTGPNGFSATTSTVGISSAGISSSGKYYVTASSTFGCIKNDSTLVTIYPVPVAMFSATTPACQNLSINFIDQSLTNGDPIKKWVWDFGNGATSNLSAPSHVFNAAGNYLVSLIVENNNGCQSPGLTKTIVVSPLPKADFLLPAICLSDPYAIFINNSAISDSSQSQFLYNWNFADGNATSNNPNSSKQKSPQHSYTSVGVYAVQLNVTSKDGCVSGTTKNFIVNGSIPVSKFLFDPAQNFCSNNIVTITNNASVNFGSITRIAIYWDFLNQPSFKITDSFPAPLKKYLHLYPDFGTPATQNFSIKYVVYSGISCVAESAQLITLKASPKIKFNSLKNVCEQDPAFIVTQASAVNGIEGTGIYSGAGISATNIFTPVTATPGLHLIRYTFTANNNCSTSVEEPITVYKQPQINAGPDRTILLGGSIILAATTQGSNLQFDWEPNISMENNHILTPKINPVQNIVYAVKATSVQGCSASDAVAVTVIKDIYIPSAFSPNGDGLNDTWVIPYLNSYAGTSVEVFNRFGQIVYFSNGNSVGWDGKFKGQPLPTGSYVYILNAGVGRAVIRGMVTIVR